MVETNHRDSLTHFYKEYLEGHRDGSPFTKSQGQFFDSFFEEYLVVTGKINIFALYNVIKHSMPRQKREKNGTGICHVMQGQESKTEVNPESWTQLRGSNEA